MSSLNNLTAFRNAEEALRKKAQKAKIDMTSFEYKLQHCSNCGGMCCYDGVYVLEETAEIIKEIACSNADFFKSIGLDLPHEVIVKGEWRGEPQGPKTAVKYRPFSTLIDNYPQHFENTACVFLTNEGLCGLQLLAEHEVKHPWYYKPPTCWLHPISFSTDGDTDCLLVIHTPETDPYKYDDYDGFISRTHCGMVREIGEPAWKILRREIEFLGKILGRDFLSEFSDESATSGV